MKATLFAAAALAAALSGHTVAGYFILQGTSIVTERIDPIVTPGEISPHVHNIVGANSINISSDYDTLQASTCTSLPITKDLSGYWQPLLYYYNTTDQTYTAIPSYSKIYYLQRPGPKKEKLHAFPPGFRMVAGNPFRYTNNATNFADQAIDFVCQDYDNDHSGDPEWANRPTFFKHNCPNGLRAQVVFPSCWNGKDLYKTDGSHMAYPIQAVNTGDCPASHPVHFITLFQEFVYDVGKFPYNSDGPTWVFATGDATGYSLHADFQNGWDVDVLQAAIDQCDGEIGGNLLACPPLAPYYDTKAADACKINGNIVDEDVGLTGPIKKLPGCNPLYISGPKPACTSTEPDPGFKPSKSTPAPGYSYVGCVAEAPNGRLLTGASTTSNSMTAAVCTAFCAQKGFEYAGTEYSDECYCGSTFANGGSNTTISVSQCSNACAGNELEDCGGSRTLSLYRNPGNTLAPVALPSGWSAAGCITDNVNHTRTLSGYSTASANMTLSQCVNTCNSRGFSYAGVEYGKECYCSNAPSSMISSTSCNMACGGDARYICGGPNALSFFTSSHVVASGYKYQGCVAEGTTGRLLTGASTTSDSMTPLACTNFCSSKGLQYSGVEYGRECYCGANFVNGGNGTSINEAKCSIDCKGDTTQKCGGFSTLSLYVNAALAPKVPVLPAGWTAKGCIADLPGNRTLPSYTFASDSMTYSTCLTGCQSRNYTVAGVEYSRECWCANAPVNDLSSSACSMPCAGDASHLCGGPNALTAFTYTAPSSKRSVKEHSRFRIRKIGMKALSV